MLCIVVHDIYVAMPKVTFQTVDMYSLGHLFHNQVSNNIEPMLHILVYFRV